jgi:hypothetical protein
MIRAMQCVVFAAADSELLKLFDGDVVVMRDASRESVQRMLAADAVVIDSACGNDAWYVLGVLHGLQKRAVWIDKAMSRESLAAAIANASSPFAGLAPSVQQPLAGVVDTASMDGSVRAHLERRGILTERELARSGRYPHADRLQEFLVKRGIFI